MAVYDSVFAIDPSLRRMGWAHFVRLDGTWVLHTHGLVKSSRIPVKSRKRLKKNWVGRAGLMIEWLVTDLFNHPSDTEIGDDAVVIELPSVYSAGRGAVARNSGAIMKLMFLVAALRGVIEERYDSEVVLVPVRKWKGTVPKEITQRRVQRRWGVTIGDDGVDHNVIDAIGIGDWYIRQLGV